MTPYAVCVPKADPGDITHMNAAINLAAMRARSALSEVLGKEAVGQIARSVAHEFNNLLTVLQSSVDLLRVPDLPQARRERYLNAIEASTDRAAQLTRQMQDIARRLAPRRAKLDIAARLTALGRKNCFTLALQAPEFASLCMVEVEPAGFDALIAQLSAALRGDAPPATMLVVSLRITCSQRQSGEAAPGNTPCCMAITFGAPPDAAGGRLDMARNLLANLPTEATPSSDWLAAFSFLDATNSWLDAHEPEDGAVTLTLYLPMIDV